MYDTPAELLRAIAAGEDSVLELKEVVFEGNKIVVTGEGQAAAWVARQISAFTNADGGVLVLGVSDTRTIIGVPADRMDALQQLVVNAAESNVEPPAGHLVRLDAMALAGSEGTDRLVLRVDIRADYYAVHAPKGKRPLVRMGNTTCEVSMELLPRLLARRGTLVSADERPVISTTPDDLDLERLGRYGHARFGSAPAPEDALRLARNLKLLATDDLDQMHVTVAGLLLFGREPQRHLPSTTVDIVVYDGTQPDTDRRLDSRQLTGTVVEQISAATAYLAASPAVPTASIKDGAGRADHPAYSLRAIEEAVVNAVAHRDYAIAGQIRLQVFDDRIEVTSPGRLPNSLSPDDLYAGASPIRRNQVLVGFLVQPAISGTDRAIMDATAEGFLTMVRETIAVSGRPPELRLHTEALTVTLPRRPRG